MHFMKQSSQKWLGCFFVVMDIAEVVLQEVYDRTK